MKRRRGIGRPESSDHDRSDEIRTLRYIYVATRPSTDEGCPRPDSIPTLHPRSNGQVSVGRRGGLSSNLGHPESDQRPRPFLPHTTPHSCGVAGAAAKFTGDHDSGASSTKLWSTQQYRKPGFIRSQHSPTQHWISTPARQTSTSHGGRRLRIAATRCDSTYGTPASQGRTHHYG